MSEEKAIKQQIIMTAKAVKKKIKCMKSNKLDSEMVLENVLKPITDPLNILAKNNKARFEDKLGSIYDKKIHNHSLSGPVNEPTIIKKRKFSEVSDTSKIQQNDDDNILSEHYSETESNSENNMSDEFFESNPDSASTPKDKSISNWSLSSEALKDVPYGVRIERGKLMIGSKPLSMTDDVLTIAGKKYAKTKGLVELLFKNPSNLTIITENDKQNYKLILLDTNAHRRKYDPKQPINANKGNKYTCIIKPLFNQRKTENISKGNGIPKFKKVKKNVDYVYWDDPNELVERLKLLIASRDAGNTGLDNEIISIIEELKEYGIIR